MSKFDLKKRSKFSKIQFFRSNLDVLKFFFLIFQIFFLYSPPEDNLQLKGLVSSLNGSKNLNMLKKILNCHFSAENVGIRKCVPYK